MTGARRRSTTIEPEMSDVPVFSPAAIRDSGRQIDVLLFPADELGLCGRAGEVAELEPQVVFARRAIDT